MLANFQKMGFAPLRQKYHEAIASMIAPTKHGGKILDPVAGEGDALLSLSKAWNLTPYGNELDFFRARKVTEKFGPLQGVQGDMFKLRASQKAFQVLYLNPPYMQNQGTGAADTRREYEFLKFAIKWLQPGGLLVYVIYKHHLTKDVAAWLARNMETVDVYEIPELDFGTYTQIVIIGKQGNGYKKLRPGAIKIDTSGMNVAMYGDGLAVSGLKVSVDDGSADSGIGVDPVYLYETAEDKNKHFPELVALQVPIYEIPKPLQRPTFIFAPERFTRELTDLLVQEMKLGDDTRFSTLLSVPPRQDTWESIIRPSPRQHALLTSAGLLNGIVLYDEEKKKRFAVAARIRITRKLWDEEDVDDKGKRRTTYRDLPLPSVTVLYEDGTKVDISDDTNLMGFVKKYGQHIVKYLNERVVSFYNFDYSEWGDLLAKPKDGKLYEAQKHAIASVLTALKRQKGAIMAADPGSGKSIMGLTIAAALKMRKGQFVVVSCPSHLVHKAWMKELGTLGVPYNAAVVRNVAEARVFMKTIDDKKLNVMIIPNSMLKLGEGWQPVYKTHWHAIWRGDDVYEVVGSEPGINGEPKRDVVKCPTCGEPAKVNFAFVRRKFNPKSGDEEKNWVDLAPRFCKECKGALWSDVRTFSKDRVTKDGNPVAYRMPLAQFLKKEARGRIGLYIADEFHESRNSNTAQADAASILANMADRVLGLTGTIYGGKASDLFFLSYLMSDRVRKNYPADKNKDGDTVWRTQEWVRDMGVLEEVVTKTPEIDGAGKLTGKERVSSSIQEAPGCSPLLVGMALGYTVFISKDDIRKDMVGYEEDAIGVDMPDDMAEDYLQAWKDKAADIVRAPQLKWAYIQSLMSFPNAPWLGSRFLGLIPRPQNVIYPKEEKLVEIVRDALARGESVGVYVNQTVTNNIQPRLRDIIQSEVPGAKVYILNDNDASKRQELIDAAVAKGTNVLITNPRRVATGLDLLPFTTLVFYEISYSLFVNLQASDRAHRINQTKDCRVIYLYYNRALENRAIQLVGEKAAALNALRGRADSGIAALTQQSSASLQSELEKLVSQGIVDGTANLSGLFGKRTRTVDEDTWEAEEVIQPTKPVVVASLPLDTVVERMEQIIEAEFEKQEAAQPELIIQVKEPPKRLLTDEEKEMLAGNRSNDVLFRWVNGGSVEFYIKSYSTIKEELMAIVAAPNGHFLVRFTAKQLAAAMKKSDTMLHRDDDFERKSTFEVMRLIGAKSLTSARSLDDIRWK